MTSFKTSTQRTLMSSAQRDRHGCAEIPPPVDADWVPDRSAPPVERGAGERDAVPEPGPEVWYG
jgi:hypothetical protein